MMRGYAAANVRVATVHASIWLSCGSCSSGTAVSTSLPNPPAGAIRVIAPSSTANDTLPSDGYDGPSVDCAFAPNAALSVGSVSGRPSGPFPQNDVPSARSTYAGPT